MLKLSKFIIKQYKQLLKMKRKRFRVDNFYKNTVF